MTPSKFAAPVAALTAVYNRSVPRATEDGRRTPTRQWLASAELAHDFWGGGLSD
ncbi:MAG TPA: hypothetical protein VJV79_40145 [Polyangiaceae bacterium]|nr:hypothetical protein [Polyangiaceae bacterium]